MKNYIPLLIVIFLANVSCSQNTYTGTIDNWENKQAEILLPTSDPIIVGKVSEKGHVQIELKDEIADAIEASLQKENERSNINIISTTVAKSFYCDPEFVEVKNGDINIQKLTGGSTFYAGDLEAQELYGQFRIASSMAFSDSYFSLGKKDFVKGYYVNFFYVEEDASVNGTCKSESYTMDMKTIVELIVDYNINLKKGWNLVKIEVAETYVDGEKIRPLKTVMSTIEAIPQDAKFILFEQ
ncbi:hypothetical protein [Winogradskyella sp. A3E31]|uniref:hypothetical protein n=1 Tax=Winogradskyella sp. A3E31 TaxID=3349637 RepID=UPI00398AB32E